MVISLLTAKGIIKALVSDLWGFMRLKPGILISFALLAMATPVPCQATPIYNNQSDIGEKLQIPVHSWTNPDRPVKGIIVALQGLIFSGRMYGTLATHFTDMGYIVYANDMRGFGDWRDPNHKFDGDSAIHFSQSKDDLTAMLKELRKKYPEKPIFCIGESFGANMAIWEASTDPTLLDGVIASSAVAKNRVHPRPLWLKTFMQGLQNPKQPIDIASYYKPLLSEDIRITQELMESAETCKAMSVTDLIKAAVTNRNALKEINKIPENMPILLLAGKLDQVQNTAALAAMVPKMGTKKATMVVLPRKGHMLIECSKIEPEVGTKIDSWLEHEVNEFERRAQARTAASLASSNARAAARTASRTTPDELSRESEHN